MTDQAQEVGIKLPTALTREVWEAYVALSDVARDAGNDERGRLHDILWMFRCAAVRAPKDASEFLYEPRRHENADPTLVTLKAICGPGDDFRPVITILLPEQD